MVANTLLEIYTLMFGWNMYSSIWDLLNGTGLTLIPFIVAVISSVKDNFSASEQTTSTLSIIKDLEMTVFTMIVVMMLCVIPFTGWGTTLQTVKYNINIPDCNVGANIEGAGDATNTGYDDAFSEVSNFQIYRPVAWSFVNTLSSAITHTTISSMSCVNNYDFMLVRVGSITLQDQSLKQQVRDFTQVCYKKAKALYEDNPTALGSTVDPVSDIDWIGSRTFLDTSGAYYSNEGAYMVNMDQYGYTRSTTTRDSDKEISSGANPYCAEVWLGTTGTTGLRELILTDIANSDDAAGDILDDWTDWGADALTDGTVTDEYKEDLLIKMVLQADAANLSAANDVGSGNNVQESSATKSWFEKIASFLGASSSIDEFMQLNLMKQMSKTAGPMIIALVQLIVIVSSPFVMILAYYRLSAFITLALSYFAFEFINAIWAISFWFDNKLLDLQFSNGNAIEKGMAMMVTYTVTTLSIFILPAIWLSLISYAGAQVTRGMGGGGVGGGAGAGSSFTNGSGKAKGIGGWMKGKLSKSKES